MPIAFSPKVMNGAMNLLGGPALPTQYAIWIAPPQGMLSSDFFASLSKSPLMTLLKSTASIAGSMALSTMAEKVSIPAKRFMTQEIFRHGEHMKLPYGVSHDTTTITFICTNSMIERTFFDVWTTFIQCPKSHYMEYFENYKTSIYIKKLVGAGILDSILDGELGDITPNNPLVEVTSLISGFKLEDAYPISIHAQELSYGETQTYLSLTVEFAYTHMTTVVDWMLGEELKGPSTEDVDVFSEKQPIIKTEQIPIDQPVTEVSSSAPPDFDTVVQPGDKIPGPPEGSPPWQGGSEVGQIIRGPQQPIPVDTVPSPSDPLASRIGAGDTVTSGGQVISSDQVDIVSSVGGGSGTPVDPLDSVVTPTDGGSGYLIDTRGGSELNQPIYDAWKPPPVDTGSGNT